MEMEMSTEKSTEWFNLAGDPTFEKLESGRFRCSESGQELPEKELDAYRRSKHCRLGMIDYALSHHKPPLNIFTQDPLSRSKLICKLTGDTINKTEKHIWIHINGKRFFKKLEEKEMGCSGEKEMGNPGEKVDGEEETVESKKTNKKKEKKNKKGNKDYPGEKEMGSPGENKISNSGEKVDGKEGKKVGEKSKKKNKKNGYPDKSVFQGKYMRDAANGKVEKEMGSPGEKKMRNPGEKVDGKEGKKVGEKSKKEKKKKKKNGYPDKGVCPEEGEYIRRDAANGKGAMGNVATTTMELSKWGKRVAGKEADSFAHKKRRKHSG